MKYKALNFDGRWVQEVTDQRITYSDTPILLDFSVTMEGMLQSTGYQNPNYREKRNEWLKKCELVEVELLILKEI